jgi:glyoxylate reductase
MARPRVYVTRLIPEAGLKIVRDFAETVVWEGNVPPPKDTIMQQVAEADGILPLLTDRIDAEVINAGRKLRVISNYAVGYDNIDVPAATARSILVCNTPGVLTETTADLAWALLMAGARHIAHGHAYVQAREWKSWQPQLFLGYDVHAATIGIIGAGRIGQAVARRAKGFSMRILYHDAERKPDLEKEVGAEYADLRTLLRESDFVTLHVPLTPETKNMINAERLALMKQTAVLVNTARGLAIDEAALYDALKNGRIAAAALDVTAVEPIPPDSPLLGLDNCTIVPHIGSASFATRNKMAVMAAENLVAALKGERPAHIVNPEVLGTSTWKSRPPL